MVLRDLGHRHAEPQVHPATLQLFGRIGVRLLGERREQGMAQIHQDDARSAEVQTLMAVRHHVVHQLGERSGGLHAGGPATHHDECERSFGHPVRPTRGVLEALDEPGPDPARILDRVERERVLASALGMEEVRLSTRGDHQLVPGDGVPVGQCHTRRARIGRGHLGGHDFDIVVLGEHVTQVEDDVLAGQLRGRHLIQQRLELVVAVAFQQGHPHPGSTGKPCRAGNACKSRTHDDDVSLFWVVRHQRCASPSADPAWPIRFRPHITRRG